MTIESRLELYRHYSLAKDNLFHSLVKGFSPFESKFDRLISLLNEISDEDIEDPREAIAEAKKLIKERKNENAENK